MTKERLMKDIQQLNWYFDAIQCETSATCINNKHQAIHLHSNEWALHVSDWSGIVLGRCMSDPGLSLGVRMSDVGPAHQRTRMSYASKVLHLRRMWFLSIFA